MDIFKSTNIKVSQKILQKISKIDEFKGEWKAFGRLSPEQLTELKKVATIESIASSTRIEGSKLSDQEVSQLMTNLSISSFNSRDEQEVAGYASVMETIFSSWEDISLSENILKQLHKELLRFSHKDEAHRGKYKTLSNNVVAFDSNGNNVGIIFETATPFDTPRRMNELLEWYLLTQESGTLHPLIKIAIFIVVFLEIHPFQDGNGRLSRVLTTYMLLKEGYGYVPYCSLESIIEHNKEAYYISLRKTQTTMKSNSPDWEKWILFFLKCLNTQVDLLRSKLEEEKTLLQGLPKLSSELLYLIKERRRLTVREAVLLTSGNRNTIKLHLNKLLERRLITKNGRGKGTWYSNI